MLQTYVNWRKSGILQTPTGWPHQSRRKKFPQFSRLFQSHKLTFPYIIAFATIS